MDYVTLTEASGGDAAIVLAAEFSGGGFVAVQHVAFESAANSAVQGVLWQSTYDRLELVAVQAQFGSRWTLDGARGLVAVAKRPPDTAYPVPTNAVRPGVTDRTVRPDVVELRFADGTTSAPAASASHPRPSAVRPI